MTKILLNTIDLQAPTQLRQNKESQLHIEDLALSYADNGEFTELPLVGMIKGSDILVPIDGFHRLRAIEWLSSDDFKAYPDAPDVSHLDLEVAEVRTTQFNTVGEAIIAAAGVNSAHGMKRKVGDVKCAISAILEVEPMMFMVNKYKLNKKVIMATVNCSSASYTRETEEIRAKYVKQRQTKMRELNEQGKSLREIAAIVGCDHVTVKNVIGVEKCSVSKIQQPEETPEEQPEQTVFTHMTSVTPIANPWEITETGAEKSESSKAARKKVMSELELATLVDSLNKTQRGFLKNYLAQS